VLGLLPDDAEQPAVVRRDGTREALIVTGNVYVIELHVRPITQQPARTEWTRHGPSDGIDVPIPADIAMESGGLRLGLRPRPISLWKQPF
jgi:hypothetical protein